MSQPNRLLVVDAEQRVRDYFAEIATLADFVVVKATDEEEMRRRLRYFDPTAVLLGLDRTLSTTTRKLKFLREAGCHGKILLLSALRDKHVITAKHIGTILGLDMNGIIPRPVSAELIREQLEALRKPCN